MKMRTTIKNKTLLLVGVLMIFMSACSELDYENTKTIAPDNVWKNKTMIKAFLSNIHGQLMPGRAQNGTSSDEAFYSPGNMNDYLRGIISVESNGQELDYGKIDKINFFLENLATVTNDVLTDTEKKQLTGQALFWRAWDYWGKVATLGGVPLILKVQDYKDKESLFIPRNKTSECVAQIIKDLDDAISMLPATWTGVDYGRIDKCAAMAFKGKVLMWYASPLFNPTNDQARWEAAYTANKDAVDFLKSQGKGLYPIFKDVWYKEQNQEVVMVNQFYATDHYDNQNGIRPQPITNAAANDNQPYVPLLTAFPKKDGSSMALDVARLSSDPEYNATYFTDFYTNRDDRFFATVFCPGTVYPTPDFKGGMRYWNAWRKVPKAGGFDYFSLSLNEPGFNGGVGGGTSGFFQLKGLDRTLDVTQISKGTVDWVEIRYAEVLMNYGECANETNKASEALQVLYDIRKRAGITPGADSKYGITATSQNEIREAYINERFVEFALEGKRWGDLRRWKRFDIVNARGYRAGLYPVLNDDVPVSSFVWTDDMTTASVRAKFHLEYVPNLDIQPQFKFNLDLKHWFYPIKKDDLDRNSKLLQNNEWGGTFDPLQ